MSDPGDWLARAQVARAEGGAEALAAIDLLDADLRRAADEIGDRLAAISLSLAQAFALAAPEVAAVLGPKGFRAWAERGASLARGERASREAAVAYFRVLVGAAAALPSGELERWIELVGRVSESSRRLGVAYLETTGRALAELGVARASKLEAFADAALRLARSGWRGEFLAAAFLANGGAALAALEPAELGELAELGVAMQTGRDLDASLFARSAEPLVALDSAERLLVFAIARAAAERTPKIAGTLHADLPGAVAALAPELRRAVLEGARAAAGETEDLARLLPWIPAIVRSIPEAARRPLLERLVALARRFPRTWIPAFRSLPRAVEIAGAEGIERWIDRGERVAEDSIDAGRAFFALESRTGLAALEEGSAAARFREVEGILRSYGRLLGESRLALREVAGASLRPALDVESLDGESFAVPSTISIFDSWEENFSVYKLMVANGVGRRLFGTFDLDLEEVRARLPEATARAFANGVGGRTLADLVDALGEGDPLLAIFVACDGARIDARLARMYRGFAVELRSVAAHLHRRARAADRPPTAELVLHLLGSGVPPRELASLSRELDGEILETIAGILRSPSSSATDALAAAVLLRERLGDSLAIAGFGTQVNYDELFFEQMVEAGAERVAAEAEDDDGALPGAREVVELPPEAVEQTDDEDAGGVPLSAEEIRRLLESGVILQVGRGTRMADGDGVFATGLDLTGTAAADDEDAPVDPRGTIAVRRRTGAAGDTRVYEYDEWDHEIRDYRPRWCRLEEIPLGGDGGEFFERALSRHADLLPEVRRQFQRIRPERYRRIRGLEDGEDFDLNAVVEAKVDLRSRRAPSSRLYVARRREERDVATLFLVDMSASTDEALASEKGSPTRPSHPRRIIDVTKEALVVMAEALEEIGDQYAIYGFSGEGRKNVEVYRVKRFSEGLGATVRGRIGAIEPKRSTRMGTALRHAISKMRGVASRSKHVLLLSDGFPQDFDYGSDRRSNAYGIQDTMMAIQECQTAGITPFCITVDKTGHDYLRLMCESSRYLVIEDVESLPLELPKIYERWVQG